MPIFARSAATLAGFNGLLHDLWFDLPRGELKPTNGRVCINLRDDERFLVEDRVSEYRFCICDVHQVEIKGEPDECPDPVELNLIEYDSKENVVTLIAVHPIQIRCRVERLYLELEQLV